MKRWSLKKVKEASRSRSIANFVHRHFLHSSFADFKGHITFSFERLVPRVISLSLSLSREKYSPRRLRSCESENPTLLLDPFNAVSPAIISPRVRDDVSPRDDFDSRRDSIEAGYDPEEINTADTTTPPPSRAPRNRLQRSPTRDPFPPRSLPPPCVTTANGSTSFSSRL